MKLKVLCELTADELCESIEGLSEDMSSSQFLTFSFGLIEDLLYRSESVSDDDKFNKLVKRVKKLCERYEKM